MKPLHHNIENYTKVVAYRRVSTKKQEKGFESQKLLIEDYAKEYGLIIDEWFEDFGVSANKVPIYKRPGYMAMEECIEHEYWSGGKDGPKPRVLVLLTSIDRLMRQNPEEDFITVQAYCGTYAQIIAVETGVNLTDVFKERVELVKRLVQEKIQKNMSQDTLSKVKKEIMKVIADYDFRWSEPCRVNLYN